MPEAKLLILFELFARLPLFWAEYICEHTFNAEI